MARPLKIFVANTDKDWFDYLSSSQPWEEVNFWQPSGSREFKTLDCGELFLFKLKAPHNKIGGGGIFIRGSLLPLSLAWGAFGKANGAPDAVTMRNRIARYRSAAPASKEDFTIGCRLISSPIFLPPEQWLAIPSDWAHNIVDGKSYSLDNREAQELWTYFQQAISRTLDFPSTFSSGGFREQQARFGSPVLITPRLGQGTFRILVTDAYTRKCAVTGEKVLPALDAAHIKPFAEGGEHSVPNGILLRKDIHSLFDAGYVTITPEHRFEVSGRVREEFSNGKEYYRLHGSKIQLPGNLEHYPAATALSWHNSEKFKD